MVQLTLKLLCFHLFAEMISSSCQATRKSSTSIQETLALRWVFIIVEMLCCLVFTKFDDGLCLNGTSFCCYVFGTQVFHTKFAKIGVGKKIFLFHS